MAEDFNSSKNSKSDQKRNCPILYKSPILVALLLIICIVLIIKYKAYSVDAIGSIISASIAVLGVYFTVMENKKKTYNEIVTRERIKWLHKIQENLALYLDLTSSNKEEREKLEEDYKNTANKVYYEILFNINHVKDEKAINALEKYHMAYNINKKKTKLKEETKDDAQENIEDEDKFEIELEKIDENTFKIKDSKELEETFKLIIEEDELKNKVIKEFVEIFYETWRDIKSEAD